MDSTVQKRFGGNFSGKMELGDGPKSPISCFQEPQPLSFSHQYAEIGARLNLRGNTCLFTATGVNVAAVPLRSFGQRDI